MITLGIITGDIVASQDISRYKRSAFYADLKSFLNKLKKDKKIDAFEIFRGDSFQCVVKEIELSLRVALMIRTYIRSSIIDADEEKLERNNPKTLKGYAQAKQDVRLAVGIGSIDFYDIKTVAHSDGEAFRLSGEALDQMKKTPYRMSVRTGDKAFSASLEPSILLLDALIQKWTSNQAETVFYKLKGWKEETIGEALNISQPAVSQRIKTAQWYALEKLLTYFENYFNIPD